MPWPRRLATLTAGAAVAALTCLTGTSPAFAHPPAGIPAHVFTPYFETYQTADSPAALSSASGAKYLTLAFLQTAAPGSCELSWNGTAPVSRATYGKDIAAIRRTGGDVIPSFGGYGADHAGEEIADSCSDVHKIAQQYEKVITTYGVTRLDMDVEDASLSDQAGLDRRNAAMTEVAGWARAHHRAIQFVYTLPTFTTGLTSAGLAVLQSAIAHRTPVTVVNVMTFDYYDGGPHEMAADTETAGNSVVAQLRTLYPRLSQRAAWAKLGITEMLGIDDYGPPEIFTLADASTVLHWAQRQRIGELSYWALQRDNGGCPGTGGSDTCSGLTQSTWQFTGILRPFTHR